MRGRRADDFTDTDTLHEAYTLQAHSTSRGWTQRPPSFTDRILLHALPDMLCR